MSSTLSRTLNEFKAALLCGVVIIIIAVVNAKGQINIVDGAIGMVMICVLAVLSMRIKAALPIQLPAFAWASLLGLLITVPWCPVSEVFLKYTNVITTAPIGTVILAAAGVSIGTKLDDVKKLSWKIVLVSLLVFCGTFFGSAIIAHVMLSTQGLI